MLVFVAVENDLYVPGWQKNAHRFSQRPRFSHPEFGPAVRWPQRWWGSAARLPEDKKTRREASNYFLASTTEYQIMVNWNSPE